MVFAVLFVSYVQSLAPLCSSSAVNSRYCQTLRGGNPAAMCQVFPDYDFIIKVFAISIFYIPRTDFSFSQTFVSLCERFERDKESLSRQLPRTTTYKIKRILRVSFPDHAFIIGGFAISVFFILRTDFSFSQNDKNPDGRFYAIGICIHIYI